MMAETSQPNLNMPQSLSSPPVAEVIGKDQIRKALETLKKYKSGKKTLEDKITRNEKWWKVRHWDLMTTEEFQDDPKPASAWLFNTIISKHADYMDSYPSADILPREEGDVEEAKRLSSIIPVVLKQNDFKKVFSEEVWYKLKNGTGVYFVCWDASKLNGLGDISIKCVDLLSIFFEPGVKDIQDSKNIFTVELVDNETIEAKYPQCVGQLSKSSDTLVKKYAHDDNIDTTNKSAVIDWYYKKNVNGKDTLQYVKFVDDIVLYATENDPQAAQRGLYDHGEYPFIFDTLFPEAEMPVGLGFIDICKNAQASIDIFNNAFEKNLQFGASPRYMVRNDGGINEEEFSNPNQLLIHVDGNLGEDSYAPINVPTIVNGNYLSMLTNKIDEMKETAGNRDVSNGGTSAGVTTASGLAALQESSGKTSRDQISASYEAYKDVVYMVIELIRQFYDMPRQFRILGERGQQMFTTYTNAGLQPQFQGNDFGIDMGYRLPVFDIEVKAEKESKYTVLSQNELALQFYNLGFFNPEMTDQALACMDMMEFEGKNQVVEKVMQNGMMYQQILQMQQQMLQMAQMIDTLGLERGTDYGMASQMADMVNENLDRNGGAPRAANVSLDTNGEAGFMNRARASAIDTTAPR